MRNFKNRLTKLEGRVGQSDRPLRVIMELPPEELTDRELEACIQGCEPWEANEKLILSDAELSAAIVKTGAELAAIEAELAKGKAW